MYHERQHRQHCLKHAINNLLQHEAFSISELNRLADSIHAQRTLFFGNYDANVLAVALDTLGLELKWHDPRDTQLAEQLTQLGSGQVSSSNAQPHCTSAAEGNSSRQQQQQQLVGIVLNVRGDGIWAKLTGGRHWLAIKCIDGTWWNLDSRLAAPSSFISTEADLADGGVSRLRSHLQQQLAGGAHIMLVYRQQTDTVSMP